MTILVFSGKLGVGKNYISEHYFIPMYIKKYQSKHPDHIIIPYFYNMGSFLKSRLYAEKNYSFQDLFINKNHHIRNELQKYGTLYRETIDKDYWIKQVDMWIKLTQHELTMLDQKYIPLFIIQDLRYKNEYQYFYKQPECHIIRIIAPDRNQKKGKSENADMSHPSEIDLDDVFFENILYNSEDNTELMDDINKILEKIL